MSKLEEDLSFSKGNIDQLMGMSGSLPYEEAKAIEKDLNDEFSNIEGEW